MTMAFPRVSLISALTVLSFATAKSDLLGGLVSNVISTVENPPILNPPNPIANLTSPQIIAYYGYPVETHTVTTNDGYILNMFRIPYGKTSTTNQTNTRGVVFIQHGLLCTSADWLVNTPNNILPLLLADAGYDVWLGNARGTKYSNGHNDPSFNSAQTNNKYWDFSWHEMGVYDIPAVLDYITTTTSVPKVFYVGHSMGGTMFYVCMSEKPQYNDKIKAMFGLAPVGYDWHMTSPISYLRLLVPEQAVSTFAAITRNWFWTIRSRKASRYSTLHILAPTLCTNDLLNLCGNLLYLIGGYNPSQTNPNVSSAVLGHFPATASSRSVLHFAEEIPPKKFRQFDYGNPLLGSILTNSTNMQRYGQLTPPDYDLTKITANINLYAGGGDTLANHTDIKATRDALINAVATYTFVTQDPNFNHFDFTYGKDLFTFVLQDVITKMNSYP